MLEGGSGEKWHHLLIQAETKFPMTPEAYAKLLPKSTHGIPVCYGNSIEDGYEFFIPKGATWERRRSVEWCHKQMETNPYEYSAQYDQLPSIAGGGVFKEDWMTYYETLPDDISFMRIYADTAHKTNEWNDYSVFEAWAYSPTSGIYLVDLVRGKWEAPELKTQFEDFYKKHKKTRRTMLGTWRLQSAKIEDKASGIGLIQTAKRKAKMTIIPIQREKDKYTRAMNCAPEVQAGKVHIPTGAHFTKVFVEEVTAFSSNDTHAHDDQCDPMFDAIEDMLIDGQSRDFSKLNEDSLYDDEI